MRYCPVQTSVLRQYALGIESVTSYLHSTFMLKVIHGLQQPPPVFKLDRRLTGSHLIDECLQEILGYIIRDQVEPWYDRVSSHQQFPNQVRTTAQQVIISFSNRLVFRLVLDTTVSNK